MKEAVSVCRGEARRMTNGTTRLKLRLITPQQEER